MPPHNEIKAQSSPLLAMSSITIDMLDYTLLNKSDSYRYFLQSIQGTGHELQEVVS